MKSRPHDRMLDPFFANLMFIIEQMICAIDIDAKNQGITLKDSQINSALVKAMALTAGKNPKIEEKTEADQFIKKLILTIHKAPEIMSKNIKWLDETEDKKPLKTSDWILTMETLIASMKTRRSDLPGSRSYLDFAHTFIDDALLKHSAQACAEILT